jgi:hypothetical protein
MKSRYYFSQLSRLEQDQFKYNAEQQSITPFFINQLLSWEHNTFRDFISGYFTWSSTTEGQDYWYQISIRKVTIDFKPPRYIKKVELC